MNADYNSLESVVRLMDQSGLNKFKISRPNSQKNTAPVYESINTTNNADAINKFKSWAELIENNNPYEMLLFNDAEAANSDDPKSKKKIVKFIFTLNGYSNNNKPAVVTGPSNTVDQSTLIKQIVAEIKASEKEDRLARLEEKLEAILNGDDEEEEEDRYQPFDVNGLMLGVNTIINNIKGMKNQNTPSAALNGPNEQTGAEKKVKLTEEQTTRLMAALNILKNVDPDIVENIERLTMLAQKQPATYKMAIAYLNSINV